MVTSYSYDFAGSLTNVVYSDGTPGITNTYDRLGRVVTVTDAQGSRTNVYDSVTLSLIEEHLPDGTVLSRSQDGFGRPSGVQLDADYSVAYAFDAAGRLGGLTATNEMVEMADVAYSYSAGNDLLTGWTNAVGGIQFVRTFETNRDLLIAVENRTNGTALSRFDYVNDAIGRRIQRTDNSSITNTFGYNVHSELTGAMMGTNSYGYAYDPIGNRLTATNNAEAWSYLSNELNQYTNITDGVTLTPEYDDDGNLLSYGDWSYGWDGENRLVSATNGAAVVQFSYDFLGRRFLKTTGTVTNEYLYDGWLLVQERIATGGNATTNRYVWGLDLSGTLQGAGGIGGLISATVNGTNVCYGYDANGNITDLAFFSGESAAYYEYDPYGCVTAMTGPMCADNVFLFSTKPFDPETGLGYWGYRYYHPELGRWLARDPIGEEGGYSLYNFVVNAPIDENDLLGLMALVIEIGTHPNSTGVQEVEHHVKNMEKILEHIKKNNVTEASFGPSKIWKAFVNDRNRPYSGSLEDFKKLLINEKKSKWVSANDLTAAGRYVNMLNAEYSKYNYLGIAAHGTRVAYRGRPSGQVTAKTPEGKYYDQKIYIGKMVELLNSVSAADHKLWASCFATWQGEKYYDQFTEGFSISITQDEKEMINERSDKDGLIAGCTYKVTTAKIEKYIGIGH